ncbi:MAG: polymer-forming cytoskeletal protein [Burkholderiaceae bacterium]|jgi:cytoskeletal protein CcmA (bactofilin family)
MLGKKKMPLIKSLIAVGTTIGGGITFEDGLRVDGQVIGDVIGRDGKPSVLVVSENASIDGAVVADHVIINGVVNGPVLAKHVIELQPKARVEGNVTYKSIELHLGALVNGQLSPLSALQEDKPALKLASKAF